MRGASETQTRRPEMNDAVQILVGNVEHGILDAEEAIAKEYLTPEERKQLIAALADEE